MKDLTKEEIRGIIRESNKDLLDETYLEDEGRMAHSNDLDVYGATVTQAAALLHRMTDNAAMDKEGGTLSDSDLESLIVDQVQRLNLIVATVENTLRAIQKGTYQRAGSGNTISPVNFRD